MSEFQKVDCSVCWTRGTSTRHVGVVAGWRLWSLLRSINQTQNQLYWQVVFTCKEYDCFFFIILIYYLQVSVCVVLHWCFPDSVSEVGRTLHISWVWWIWIHVLTRISPEWTDESFCSCSPVRSKPQSDGCAENTSPELQSLVWREKSSGESTDPWGAPGAAASCLPGLLTLRFCWTVVEVSWGQRCWPVKNIIGNL